MKMEELKQLSQEDLNLKLEDLQEEYTNLLLQHSTRQLDNPLRIRSVRKDIARVKTILREYDLGIRQ